MLPDNIVAVNEDTLCRSWAQEDVEEGIVWESSLFSV